MKTKKQLDKLSQAIGNAVRAYHQAIFDNLKESGKEYKVQGYDEDTNGKRLMIQGRYEYLINIVVDKIRFTKKTDDKGYLEVHINEEEYEEKDYWFNVDYIGCDEIDYVFDYIEWEE